MKPLSVIALISALIYSLFFGIYFSGFLVSGEVTEGTVKDKYYSSGNVENRTHVSVSYINESDSIHLPLAYQPFVNPGSNEEVPVVYNNGRFYVGTKSIMLVIVLSLLAIFASSITLLSYTFKKDSVSLRAKNITLVLLFAGLVIVTIL